MNSWVKAILATSIICGSAVQGLAQEAEAPAKSSRSLTQVTYDIKYLASDELGGRQPGTPGMEKAEKYIIEQYKEAGLKPAGTDGTYIQAFSVGGERKLKADQTEGALVGPDGKIVKLELGESMSPLICRNSIQLNNPLVFVGYSIRSEDHNYDEYKDIDVKDKVVVMIRREPQQEDEGSVFDGTEMSSNGYIRTKLRHAREAGAAAVILVNDGVTAATPEKDELVSFNQFGNATLRMPTINITRKALDQVLASTPILRGEGSKLSNLADVEKAIDENLSPLSQEIKGWKIEANAEIVKDDILANNIVGIIEGEGPNADETIVIGAHHDHLGMGAYGSRAPGRNEIHNGADDNATGTAAVMELARRFKASGKKPGRRLVFVCFSAEEMGLLGARHYVANPIFPLEKTVAMINFDMIGWLRDSKLTCFNWNTSPEFAAALDAANSETELNLVKPASGFAGSDHLPFNQKGIPNIFFHTGLTGTYHTPEDDFETINCAGAVEVIDFVEGFVSELSSMEKRPSFGRPKPVRLGVELIEEDDKVMVGSIEEDSLAASGGLKKGDQIVEIAERQISRRRHVTSAIRRNAGKVVKFKLMRDGNEVVLNIQLKND